MTGVKPPPPRGGRFWPWFVAALLAATAVSQALFLYAATHDTAFAIEPDYYRKAVAWDSTMARERESLALGWSVAAQVVRGANGEAGVELRLVDRNGRAVTGAHIRATAIHNLDAARPLRLNFEPSGDGYRAPLRSARTGLWELRISATTAGSHFTPVLRVELAP